MIVGHGDGHHQARFDFSFTHDGLHHAAAEAENRHFGAVDDGREMRAADGALVRNGEGAAAHVVEANLPVARLGGEFHHVLRELQEVFLVHVADDRHEQARFGVHGETEVNVFLEHDLVREFVEAGVERGMLLQRVRHGLQHERRDGELRAFLFVFGRKFLPQIVQRGDIHFVELRDFGNGQAALGHALRDDFAQRRDRALVNRTKRGEVHRLRRSDAGTARLRNFLRGGEAFETHDVIPQFLPAHAAFFVAAHLVQINRQFARNPAHGGWGDGILVHDFRIFGLAGFLFRSRRRSSGFFRGGLWRGGFLFRRTGCGRGGGGPGGGIEAENESAHGEFVAFLHANAGHGPGGGRRDGRHGLAGLQFDEALAFLHLRAGFDENADHRAGIRAFTQIRKLYVHKFKGGNLNAGTDLA